MGVVLSVPAHISSRIVFCYFRYFSGASLTLAVYSASGGSAVQHDATMAFSDVPGSRGCNEGARPLATFLVDLFVRVTFETF